MRAASARRGRRALPADARPPAGPDARARGRAPRGAATRAARRRTSFARIISSSTSTCACASASSQASATPPSPSKRNASSGVCTCRAPRANLAARHSVASRSFSARDAEHGRRRLAPLGLSVGEPRVRPDDRAVEERRSAGRHLDGHAEAILVRAQRAEIVGQVVGQHRRDRSRHVRRERALHGALVERCPGADEVRDVGDVHPGADPFGLLPERERVVEVLRGVRVDGVGEQVAQVDAALERGLRGVVRLEPLPRRPSRRAGPRGRSRSGSPARAPARRARGRGRCEPPRGRRCETSPIPFDSTDRRHAGREVRLADDEAAAAADLDHQPGGPVAQTRRKRRMVRPEPSAPMPSPMPSRMSAVIGNARA